MKPTLLRQTWLLATLAVVLSLSAKAATTAPVTVPRFTHPGSGQVCYFLMTDRFANGSTANDTGGLSGSREVTGFDPTDSGYFHGGDFQGLIGKLDYIRNLGATAVWVTPPFRNKAYSAGSAGYHGYWILDFLRVDPHLGTNDDFHAFVTAAHARGLKVYLDIIVNHTADVISYPGNTVTYVPKATAPYRDAEGQPFEESAFAYNGIAPAPLFPRLSTPGSFAYVPQVPAAEADAKYPAWLNNPVYYHNRGDSSFRHENSLHGDFAGLDDVFTEHPDVVRGFIDIYSHWIDAYGVDGFRIDTAKHVNMEFWEAFSPAIREHARQAGRPGFIQFGEVMDETHGALFLSEFSRTGGIDTTLDFPLMGAIRGYVAKREGAERVLNQLALDDHYTGPATSAHTNTTFLGNHDLGRFGYFVQHDDPQATPAQQLELARLAHGLLFLLRGQPVVYYGDEQGMVGAGGKDKAARESMYASRTPEFRDASLLGTTRSGADDKFDEQHPLYRTISDLARLRLMHPALSRGALLPRPAAAPGLLAFSRLERGEQVEYLAAFNNSRTEAATSMVPTSQRGGATLRKLHDSQSAGSPAPETLTAAANGSVSVTLAPLQFAVWRAAAPLAMPAAAPTVSLAAPAAGTVLDFPLRESDGHFLPVRQEIRAEVAGGDGVAEVTFTATRSSRPGQVELLGTDDAPPYRVFWRPPPDLAAGEEFAFTATVSDLRGHAASASVGGLRVTPGSGPFGQRGASVPVIKEAPPAAITVAAGETLALRVRAQGTGPLTYQWLRDGQLIAGATEATFLMPRAGAASAGKYRALVHGLAGSVVGPETVVTVPAASAGRIETLPSIASRFVPPRRVDVWLPPGYDASSRTRYPVIYLQDGQNCLDQQSSLGGESWEIDRALVHLMQAGKTRGAIVVAIWNTGMGRYTEYLPQRAVTGDLVSLFPGLPGVPTSALISDAYLRYIVEELKPAIDRAYRTQPDRAHTFMMGSSMGGLISAYAVASHPNVFGGAACLSTHWVAGDGAVADYLARHLPPPAQHRLYFDHGTVQFDGMYAPHHARMDAALKAAGYQAGRNWVTKVFEGADHSERSWRQRAEIPLEFLLAGSAR